jgi:hypothetical protein
LSISGLPRSIFAMRDSEDLLDLTPMGGLQSFITQPDTKYSRDRHQQIVEPEFEAPEPAILQRGGGRTFGSYAKPFGVMVEVSCSAAERSNDGSRMEGCCCPVPPGTYPQI